MHVVSCLGGNGRVDTNFVNTGPRAANYRIEFEGLTARANTIEAADWWRMPITGRRDGSYTITIMRDGSVISTQTVTVACDGPTAVDTDEIRLVNACRNGRGYLLFQFVNSRATAKSYVIEFEGVMNRSTTASGHGQAVRAVTGRPDRAYTWLVREGSQTVETGTVNVGCVNPGNAGPTWDPGSLSVSRVDEDMISLTWPRANDPDGVRGYYVFVPTNGGTLLFVDPSQTEIVIPVKDPDGRWDLSEDMTYRFDVFADDPSGANSVALTASLSLCAGREATVIIADGDLPTDGDDVVLGTDGVDSVELGAGNDVACLLGGDDTAEGGDGDDRIWLGSGNDQGEGNDGDDDLFGDDGVDFVRGGAGNDSLHGGAGADTLWGEAGRDTADGGAGNDQIQGGGGDDTARGGLGDDQIIGDIGDDNLQGDDGNDAIFGNAGNDFIIGGTGVDTVTSGDGADRVLGGLGTTTVDAGNGDDFVDALGGMLIAEGGSGDDTIIGGPFADSLFGGDGSDLLIGNDGPDLLRGGDGSGAESFGNDRLSGGAGNDNLFGDSGDDDLQGGDGADELSGGAGNDLLFGGSDFPATNTFDGGPGADTITRPHGADNIAAFGPGDLIDVVSVPADIGGVAPACNGSSVAGYLTECDTFYALMQNFPDADINEWGHVVLFDCDGPLAPGPSCLPANLPTAARNFLDNDSGGNTYSRFQEAFTTFRGWGMPNPANNPEASSAASQAETWTAIVFTGSTSYTNRSNSTGLIEYGVNADLSGFAVARDVFRQMIYAIVPAESPVLATSQGRDLVDGLSTWAARKEAGLQITCSQAVTCNLSDYERPYGPGSSGVLFYEYLAERTGGFAFITQLLSDVDSLGNVEAALIANYGRDYRDYYWSSLTSSINNGGISCAPPCELAASVDGGGTLIGPDEPAFRDATGSIDIAASFKRKDYTWSDETKFRVRGYLNPNCVQFDMECESIWLKKFRPEYTAQAAVLKLFNADYGNDWRPGTHIDENLQWEVSPKPNTGQFRIDIVEGERFIYEVKRHTGPGTAAATNDQLDRYLDGVQFPRFIPGLNGIVDLPATRGTRTGFVLAYFADGEWWFVWAPEPGHVYFDTVENAKAKGLRIQGIEDVDYDTYLGGGQVDPVVSAAAALGAAILLKRGAVPTNVPVGEPILVP